MHAVVPQNSEQWTVNSEQWSVDRGNGGVELPLNWELSKASSCVKVSDTRKLVFVGGTHTSEVAEVGCEATRRDCKKLSWSVVSFSAASDAFWRNVLFVAKFEICFVGGDAYIAPQGFALELSKRQFTTSLPSPIGEKGDRLRWMRGDRFTA